jgi:hypothetical protein
LPTGRHRLALSLKGRTPVEADDAVALEGPSKIRGSYTDNRGTRIGGWVLMGTSIAVGSIVALAGMSKTGQDCSEESITGSCITTLQPDLGLALGGLLVMGAGSLIGLVMIVQHDHASFEVTAVDQALRLPSKPSREGAWLATAPVPYGLGIRAHF